MEQLLSGLDQYTSKFRELGYNDVETICDMADGDFKECGIFHLPGCGGRILEKFDPCARPCAVLVQCLERLVHLGFAMGAVCGKPDFKNDQTNTALRS